MDPITIAVVTAATGKFVELAGDPVRDKAKQLYAMLRGRSRHEAEFAAIEKVPDGPEKARVLEGVIRRAAEADPEVRREAEALEALIRQAMDANAEFRAELEELREAVQTRPQTKNTNTFNGTAQKVVQIESNSGTIKL